MGPPVAATPPASNARIIAPAVALMISAAWKLFGAITGMIAVKGVFSGLGNFGVPHFGFPQMENLPVFSIFAFALVPALVIFFGAYQMLRLNSYAWSMAAAIFSVVLA